MWKLLLKSLEIPPEEGAEMLSLKELTKAKVPKIEPSFDLSDKNILNQVQAQNRIAAGNIYKRGYAAHVTDSINKTLKRSGIGRKQMGKDLQKNLERSLGLKPGQAAIKLVPKRFPGTAQQYFSGLAGTTLNRAQSGNRIQMFKQGGFTTYQIGAVIDRRTSQICNSMNGRTFTVQQGEQHITKVLGATSSAGLASAAPWRRDLSSFGKSPSSKTLADAGMALPPYHFRCRTQVFPISSGVTSTLISDEAVTRNMSRQMRRAESATDISRQVADAELVRGEKFLFKGSEITVTKRFFVKAKNMEYVGFTRADGTLGKARIHVFKEKSNPIMGGPTVGGTGPARPLPPAARPTTIPSPIKPVAVKPKDTIPNPAPSVKQKPVSRKGTPPFTDKNVEIKAKRVFELDEMIIKKGSKKQIAEILNYIEQNPALLKILKSGAVRKLRFGFGTKGARMFGFFQQGGTTGNLLELRLSGLAGKAKETMVHEMGHAFEKLVRSQRFGKNIDTIIKLESVTAEGLGTEVFGKPPFVSWYAKTKPSEDFAESFAQYIMEPKMFRKIYKVKAKAFDDLIEKFL